MGKKRPANEWQIRAVKAESENKRLVKDLQSARDEASGLRRKLGWQENLTPTQNSAVVDYLDALDTLALESSANQAIRTDTVRVSGSKTRPSPNVRPVHAHNLLNHQIDHLHQLTRSIRSWLHHGPPVDSRRQGCRRCKHELDLSVRDLRYCPNCGLDRRPPPAA